MDFLRDVLQPAPLEGNLTAREELESTANKDVGDSDGESHSRYEASTSSNVTSAPSAEQSSNNNNSNTSSSSFTIKRKKNRLQWKMPFFNLKKKNWYL